MFSGLGDFLDNGTINWLGKTRGERGASFGGGGDDFSFGLVRLEGSERWRCSEGHYHQNCAKLLVLKLTKFALVVTRK